MPTRSSAELDPLSALVRRWAVEWLAARNPLVGEQILAKSYTMHIGGVRLQGRSDYLRATLEQLDRFPGLGLTIHELISTGERLAVRFTEHGADASSERASAAWGGVALFRWDGSRLTACWAEEDYLSRRRQLRSGVADPVERPALAPWTTPPQDGDPGCEAIVRAWLATGILQPAELDDGWLDQDVEVRLSDPVLELDEVFAAGNRTAFHGALSGGYGGGIPGLDAHHGDQARLNLAGVVEVHDGRVVGGRVIRDRLGLQRALQRGTTR